MPAPLTLYSTCARLAYVVAQTYYNGLHYLWCAPAPVPDRFGPTNPPSSDPIRIYWSLLADIEGGDGHSAKIESLRQGIVRGAETHMRRGTIGLPERDEIESMVALAPLADFKPLLLVMPHAMAQPFLRPAPIASRARATSLEYIAEDLPRSHFDVLELEPKP